MQATAKNILALACEIFLTACLYSLFSTLTKKSTSEECLVSSYPSLGEDELYIIDLCGPLFFSDGLAVQPTIEHISLDIPPQQFFQIYYCRGPVIYVDSFRNPACKPVDIYGKYIPII